jgi:hypothetical protein
MQQMAGAARASVKRLIFGDWVAPGKVARHKPMSDKAKLEKEPRAPKCILGRSIVERDVAIRIDGMLIGARGGLDGIAHYMKNNLSDEDSLEFSHSIGEAMAALIDISATLHARFPGILPRELIPPTRDS